MENVIIKFVADTSGLEPAIKQLELLGKISKDDAAAFAQVNNEQKEFIQNLKKTEHLPIDRDFFRKNRDFFQKKAEISLIYREFPALQVVQFNYFCNCIFSKKKLLGLLEKLLEKLLKKTLWSIFL